MRQGDKRINWSETEIALLVDLLDQGKSTEEAARLIGRSVSATLSKRKQFNLRDKTRSTYNVERQYSRPIKDNRTHTRACLCCEKPFPSEGPHNRLCQYCRQKEPGAEMAFHGAIR
jgi:rRNA maturation endonuclease Nob1